MSKLNLNASILAASLMFSIGAMAQNMSKSDYEASESKIEADYKSDKAACASLSGNAKDICKAEAKGKMKVEQAELEARYKPSAKTHYEARVAKAEADYAVARERCDDLTGNKKDVCIKEAKAAQTAAKADAKMQMKTSDANATAKETSQEARNKASGQAAEARKEAAEDKSDARYQVEKEKCDQYSGMRKDQCLDQAKMHFGK